MKIKDIKGLVSQAQELVAEAEETGEYDGEDDLLSSVERCIEMLQDNKKGIILK